MKKLCAALLRSFRGQHSEKMKGSARGNWDPREVQQPFRPNPNGVGDRTTTLRRLLIGAVEMTHLTLDGRFLYSSFSQKLMTVETRVEAFSGDINKLLLIKKCFTTI